MRNVLLIGLTMAACGSAHAQVKERVAACVEREIAKVRTTQNYAKEGGVTCSAGHMVWLQCRQEDKNETVTYVPQDGYRVIDSELTIMSKTDRGAVGALSWNEKGASVQVSCAGNACDKGDREWAGIKISGTVQRIPTEADRKAAMDRCLDEVLK